MPTTPAISPKSPKTRVTTKVKKFAKSYIKHGGNATQAAMEIQPYTYDSARQVGSKMMKRQDVQEAIREALEENEITIGWLMSQRKKLIQKGIEQVDNGFDQYQRDEKGNPIKKNVEISPKDIHSHLQGIEKMIEVLGGNNSSDNSNASKHLHLHLEQKTMREIVDKRNELNSWFSGILQDEEGLLEENNVA